MATWLGTYFEFHSLVSILLFIFNGLTGLFTALNLLYLYKKFPKIKRRGWDLIHQKTVRYNSTHALLIDEKETTNIELMNEVHFNRVWIQVYFYIVAAIPFGVSCVCHFGVMYPLEAIWIFPAMHLLIAAAYICFIKMLAMSCDGGFYLQKWLEEKPDECASKRLSKISSCCLRENAAKGVSCRGRLTLLIIFKPIVNYAMAYGQYFHAAEFERSVGYFFLKVLTIFTTAIPIKTMNSLHKQLLPMTRMRRSTAKRQIVTFLAPVCQLQEVVITLLFNANMLWRLDFDALASAYRWVVGFGLLLTMEMFVCSVLMVWYAFRPQDLRLWEYHEALLKKHKSKINFNYDTANRNGNDKMEVVNEESIEFSDIVSVENSYKNIIEKGNVAGVESTEKIESVKAKQDTAKEAVEDAVENTVDNK